MYDQILKPFNPLSESKSREPVELDQYTPGLYIDLTLELSSVYPIKACGLALHGQLSD